MDDSWIGNDKVLLQQMDIVTQILQLGAYSIPAKVLDSEVFDLYFLDAIKKDLYRCLADIRKGNLCNVFMFFNCWLGLMFAPPARFLLTVMADYMRVSMDAQPYAFYCCTKTLAYAVTNANTAPMETVRLNAPDGCKFYKKVSTLVICCKNFRIKL